MGAFVVAFSLSAVASVYASKSSFNSEMFSVQPRYGSVSAQYPVLVPNDETKTLILIQDAHLNYEAHKNIAAILEQLHIQYGLRLILIESADGQTGMSHLRGIGGKEYAIQLAERYLKSGMISGDEYLDMTSDYPLTLWGIEDMDLYDQNFEAYEDAEQVREQLQPLFDNLNEAIAALKVKVASPKLLEIEAQVAAFDEGTVSFNDYLDNLKILAKNANLSLEPYAELQSYFNLQQQESIMDMESIGESQRSLYQVLQKRADAAALRPILEMGKQLKAGQVSRHAFYMQLAQTAQDQGLKMTDFPALSGYVGYLKQKNGLSFKAISDELRVLQNEIRLGSAQSPAEANWIKAQLAIASAERLLNLKWLPHDWESYKQTQSGLDPLQWFVMLKPLCQQHQIELTAAIDLQEAEASLKELVRFYELVEKRNVAILDRSLEKMKTENTQVAAMVMGGFHTQGLAELFNAHNTQLLVVSPNVGETNDEQYHKILKYKQGVSQARFDELLLPVSE